MGSLRSPVSYYALGIWQTVAVAVPKVQGTDEPLVKTVPVPAISVALFLVNLIT